MVCTNKVFIFPNPTRAKTQRALPEILDFLLSEGFSVTMEERYEYMLGEEYPIVSFYPMETAAQQSDFVLVVVVMAPFYISPLWLHGWESRFWVSTWAQWVSCRKWT